MCRFRRWAASAGSARIKTPNARPRPATRTARRRSSYGSTIAIASGGSPATTQRASRMQPRFAIAEQGEFGDADWTIAEAREPQPPAAIADPRVEYIGQVVISTPDVAADVVDGALVARRRAADRDSHRLGHVH